MSSRTKVMKLRHVMWLLTMWQFCHVTPVFRSSFSFISSNQTLQFWLYGLGHFHRRWLTWQATAVIRLHLCAVWSQPLLVTNATLLKITWCDSNELVKGSLRWMGTLRRRNLFFHRPSQWMGVNTWRKEFAPLGANFLQEQILSFETKSHSEGLLL